jgi:hypothetical protein
MLKNLDMIREQFSDDLRQDLENKWKEFYPDEMFPGLKEKEKREESKPPAGAEGASEQKRAEHELSKHNLLSSFRNAVVSAIEYTETDLSLTVEHMDKFIEEEAMKQSVDPENLKCGIMEHGRFNDYWDTFIRWARGEP